MKTEPHPWFTAFTKGQALSASSETVYNSWWSSFVKFLGGRGLSPAEATPDLVEDFLAGYAGNTALRYFRLLEKVYERAVLEGLASRNPLTELAPTYRREEDRVVVAAAASSLMERLRGQPVPEPGSASWKKQRDHVMVLLAAETGLRRREILELETFEVNLLFGTVDIRKPGAHVPAKDQTQTQPQTSDSPKKKDELSRSLPLSAQLRAALTAWLARRADLNVAGTRVFPASIAGDALDPATVYRIIERHLKAVGAGRDALGKSGAQVLRASVAWQTRQTGTSMPEVQARLGHRLLSSTEDLINRVNPRPVAHEAPRQAPTPKPGPR